MPAPTAEPMLPGDRNSPYAPRIRDDIQGMFGIRHYRVDTHEEEAALVATGLPRYGTQWSEGLPLLRCFAREVVYHAGSNDAGGMTGGRCHVRCDYRRLYDGTVLPMPGVSYTEIGTRLSSLLTKNTIEGAEDSGLLIENNAGVTKEVGGSLYRVTIFPNNQFYNASVLEKLQYEQAVNSDILQLPYVKGLGVAAHLTVPVGRARYHDFNISVEANFLKVQHILLIADVDLSIHVWRTNDSRGSPTGPTSRRVNSQIYHKRPMASLFNP